MRLLLMCLACGSLFVQASTLELLQKEMFGVPSVGRPADLQFTSNTITYAAGKGCINLLVVLPVPRALNKTPLPVFLFGDHRRNSDYPDIPIAAITRRGYAYVKFNFNDVDPDFHDGFTNGVHAIYDTARTSESWGTIAAWAWGFSRVMDWIETQSYLDATRVAIVGHSRGGKTALWAGATDQRFALAISNGSGTGGARLLKMDLPKAETIAQINTAFPHWFCANFKKYTEPSALPFDADDLLGLMAPRLLYVASATEDVWAGPQGEFSACVAASRFWQKHGKTGLAITTFPPPDQPSLDGSIGYHVRTGKHVLTPYDWEQFMNFADRHMR